MLHVQSGCGPGGGAGGGGYGTPKANDGDNSYSSYNNWSNVYNNYSYSGCPPPPPPPSQTVPAYPGATPHSGPTMVVCPQVISTFNQNQIHVHLHATDKFDQYLGPAFTTNLSNANRSNGGIDVGIGTTDPNNTIPAIAGNPNQSDVGEQQDRSGGNGGNGDNTDVVGTDVSVWRPY